MAGELAIANYRVSSVEQLENNSLNTQKKAVKEAALKLGVEIVEEWSGSISSKAGTNIKRPDLQAMLDYCKKNKRVKYAIFNVYDRFMRDMQEGMYFEVMFKIHGVKVWYASMPDEFNKDDLNAKLLKALEGFKAEGSNNERIRQSITGGKSSIAEGRWPFTTKLGYKRGYIRGIQEIHEIKGPALRETLVKIASYRLTPTAALKEFNNYDFMKKRAMLKMDKFRGIITDPYYAGILVMDKQIKARNDNGLHEPLISIAEHNEIVKIMSGREKSQTGPSKAGNSEFPLNNLVTCELCLDKSNGRVVGSNHTNGKASSKVWPKYRCRSCRRYISRDLLHEKVKECIEKYGISPRSSDTVIETLIEIWRSSAKQREQDAARINNKIKNIQQLIANQVESVTDPDNAIIKAEILASIAAKKAEINDLENQLSTIHEANQEDMERFIKYAFTVMDSMYEFFLEMDYDFRLGCKQAFFPGGFIWKQNGEVYTPQVSPIYSLLPTKKDLSEIEKSLMVRVRGL